MTSKIGKLDEFNYQGFTIIEILVVLAIIVIMLGIGVPFFRGNSQRAKLKSAIRGVVSALNYAKSEAMTERKWVKVVLEDNCLLIYMREAKDSWINVDKKYCFPAGVEAEFEDNAHEIIFYPSGEADSRVCLNIFNDIGKHRKVCASPMSGKVYIQ